MNAIRLQINEDDRSLRRTLVERLSAKGYECLEASDGREGLRVFVHECPDVVMTDLQMAPSTAWSFCDAPRRFDPRLRSSSSAPSVTKRIF